MGQFRLSITASGGHGCQREVKDGQELIGCGRMGCPDCEAMRVVAEFIRRTGSMFEKAELVHWPGTSGEVRDEIRLDNGFARRIRHGSF